MSRVLVTQGLKADGLLVVLVQPLEGGLAVTGEADEAVLAAVRLGAGLKNHDVPLVVLRLHGIAHDASREGLRIVDVRATDVLVGNT